MNLQELLKERERIDKELEKYEIEMQKRSELLAWKDHFGVTCELPSVCVHGFGQIAPMELPSHIRKIILNALQTEIDKLEKE